MNTGGYMNASSKLEQEYQDEQTLLNHWRHRFSEVALLDRSSTLDELIRVMLAQLRIARADISLKRLRANS